MSILFSLAKQWQTITVTITVLKEFHAPLVYDEGALLSIQLFFNGRRTRAERTDGTLSS